jgi:16S rRNA (guanine966-N2)-methyltransferase
MVPGRARRLRVVAGELGGRRLVAPDHDEVRPSTERTREAVFSMLGEVSGAALDLFCGSGAFGIEAVSRGADRATFVDADLRAVRENVRELGIGDRSELVRADAISFLRSDVGEYDVVFCDPPYRLADRLGPELRKLLPPRLRKEARVIVESSPELPLELDLPLLRERRYGSSLVRIHGEEL